MLAVWPILSPEATLSRAMALAAAIGFNGNVVEDSETIRVAAPRIGPVGQVTLSVMGGSAGVGSRPLAAFFGGQCSDTQDNDLDGLTDDMDLGCEGLYDADETLAGFQARPGADIPRLEAMLAPNGQLSLASLALPALTAPNGSGGTLRGVLSLTSAASGSIELTSQRATLVLPLQLTLTCEGPGCFSGSCTVELGTVTLRTDDTAGIPYRPADGQATLSAGFTAPGVTSCSAGTMPAQVNALVGLPDANARLTLEVHARPIIEDVGPVLSLSRTSGAIIYRDAAATLAPTPAPSVPGASEAELLARTFLSQQGLLPPEPEVRSLELYALNRESQEVLIGRQVIFTPRIMVERRDDQPVLAPVLGSEVEVDVGEGGRVLGLRSRWRPVGEPLLVPPRAEADVLGDVADAAVAGSAPPLELLYLSYSDHSRQPYYDPVFAVVARQDKTDLVRAAAPATLFTPRLASLQPQPATTVDGANPVPLRVSLTGGMEPYQISWESSLDGPLGQGAAIDAPLSNGRHAISLTVSDARGAGYHLSLPLEVTGSSRGPGWKDEPAPRAQQQQQLTGTFGGTVELENGTSYTFGRRQVPATLDSYSPFASRFRGTDGRVVLEQVFLEQWRYSLTLTTPQGPIILRSDKCVPGALQASSGGACYVPTPPFAVPESTGPSIALRGGRAHMVSKVVIKNLPGTFTLDFDYRAEDVQNPACAEQGDFKNFGAETLAGSPLVRKASGSCPGFVPQVNWTYEPPGEETGGSQTGVPGQDIESFCVQSIEINNGRNTDNERFCEMSPEVREYLSIHPGERFQVSEFKASLYTAVAPQDLNQTLVAVLVRDADNGEPPQVANSDGALLRAYQPPNARGRIASIAGAGDLYTVISPIANEKVVNVAQPPNEPGTWDNYHAKRYPGIRLLNSTLISTVWDWLPADQAPLYYVHFPNCNSLWFPFDRNAPCLHLHERWFNGRPFSRGQTVNWALVRDDVNPRYPRKRPPQLVGPLPLYSAGTPRVDQNETVTDSLLWHESTATSAACDHPAGGVNNRGRPCRVFTSPIFVTH
jgi:hypothetical protein